METTLIQHLLGLIITAATVAGPVPLCLVMNLRVENSRREHRTTAHQLVVLAVCWCFIQTALMLCLGICHQVTLPSATVAEAILFIAGSTLLYRTKKKFPGLRLYRLFNIRGELGIFEKISAGIMASAALIIAWTLLSHPITDYDSLAYHLPAMAEWTRNGYFSRLPLLKIIGYYPYNWEALCTLFLFPFKGSDVMVAVPNLAAWGLFGLSGYSLGRELKIRRHYLMGLSSLVSITPIVMENLLSMHVDLPLAAFFMAGLYFIAVFSRTRSRAYILLIFANIAMVTGIKTSGLLYGFLLTAIFIYKYFKPGRPPVSDSPWPLSRPVIFTLIILAAAVVVLVGGYWYIRNIFDTGNPFGNIRFEFAGFSLFPGETGQANIFKTTLASTFKAGSPNHWKIMLNAVYDKLSLPFFIIGPAAIMYLAVPFRRRKMVPLRSFVFFTALMTVAAIIYLITPYSGSTWRNDYLFTPWFSQAFRYALPLLGLVAVAAAIGFQHFSFRSGEVTLFLAVAALFIFFIYGGAWQSQTRYLLIAGIFFTFVWSYCRNRFYLIKTYRKSIAVIILLAGTCITYWAGQFRIDNQYRAFNMLQPFLETHVPPGQPVGTLHNYNIYSLYGKYRERDVIPVSSREKSFPEWINHLQNNNISYIVIGKISESSLEDKTVKWITDPDGMFEWVKGTALTGEYTIYRLKKETASEIVPVN